MNDHQMPLSAAPDDDGRRLRPADAGCACPLHALRRDRRLFTGALLAGGATLAGWSAPAAAQAPPDCRRSWATNAIPAETVEGSAQQQYQQMMRQAQQQRALAPSSHPQLQRLRYIAARIIPFAPECNPRASSWRWEINLIGARTINAFCMPGGKIAFFHGILSELRLDDDEVAMIMGHEAAHALLEHAREQMGKNVATTGLLRLGAALLGLGDLGDAAARMGAQLLSLKYSRDDESQADRLGLVMAARAGYDPRKGVSLWEKMGQAGGGTPPAMLSTHPSGPQRIREIEAKFVDAMPLFERAEKPDRRFALAEPLK